MFYRIFALDVRRSLLGRWKRFSVALLFFVLVAFACKISFANAYLQSPELTPFCDAYLGGLFVVVPLGVAWIGHLLFLFNGFY